MGETASRILIGPRKVMEVGNSDSVTIPAEVLEDMDLATGDSAMVVYDREEKRVLIENGDSHSFL